ncbi:hypothetical protein PGT21_027544 [Puccinia graminis f. sp. tritici]|uniref:Uncharacterized protein n=1 Tax=Puccinia graminis f. sp. tritici TaxID=56615 RepID=A0A5B0R1Q6_PUCGR|nr:hypothetical protein PGT21_027544 [Puccinia graminis f. sp. tritici]
MAQNPSSASPSSNSASSTPSTPVAASSEPKQPIFYSRAQLLALHNSPLCVRPPALKPLSEWFGDCDFASARSQPNHATPNANQPPNQRSSPENKSQALSQSVASLPVLGRSQPPARNPFANFGKFGTEESSPSNSFSSLHLNGSSSPLNNSFKGARRLMDRDGAPHIARTDNLNVDGNRRKPNENSVGTGKERSGNQRIPDDQGSSDGKLNNNNTNNSNRRTLDRYVPDRDRDDARLRNRERERERDLERDKTRRSSLNPRDGPTGDEQMNWRRPPPGTTGGPPANNSSTKRSTSYHQTTNVARANKDTPDTRDHSVREKEREKTINNKYAQTSNASNRNNNQQRAREKEKENTASHSPSNQIHSSASHATASRDTPPISPNVPLTSHTTRRVKDGAWDSGEGKWEISKPSNGLRNDSGYGTSETDAIQTWKAEMKALEAQKKLAAAASLSAAESRDDSSTPLPSPVKVEERVANRSTPDPHVEVPPKPDRDLQSNSSKQFDFAVIGTSSSPNENVGTNSHPAIENDLAVLPRASRFAKFFDHHKDGGQQTGSAYKNDSEKGSPPKSAGSPSADPENMARVLSMLQMSSKPSEPASDSTQDPQSHSSSFQLLNKLLPSNGQPTHYNRDPMGFAQLHGASSTSPTTIHAPGVRSHHEAELGDRIQTADDHTLNHLSHHTLPASSTPFSTFAGDSPQRSSPAHQMGGLDDLSSHSSADHFSHLSASQSGASHAFGSQNGNPGSSPHGSQSIGSAVNQPFSLFATNHPPHVKSPIDASFGGVRNQAVHDPQMFQLRHMLHSVNSNNLGNIPAQQLAHDRSTDNQKLAFLSRQLHQQRMPSNFIINPTSSANHSNAFMSLNLASPRACLQIRYTNWQGMSQFEQQQQQQQQQNGLEYQRRLSAL